MVTLFLSLMGACGEDGAVTESGSKLRGDNAKCPERSLYTPGWPVVAHG